MTLRHGKVSVEGSLPQGVPTDRGILAAMEAVLSHYRAPSLPGLPPLHGGLVGYLGYDVVREVEQLPDAPTDELGYPDAIVGVVGQIAAYDAWRQRVTLVEAVPVPVGCHHRRRPRPVRRGAPATGGALQPRAPSRSRSRSSIPLSATTRSPL